MTDKMSYNDRPDIIFLDNLKVHLKSMTSDYVKAYYKCGDLIIEFYYNHELSFYHNEMCIYGKIISGLSSETLAEQIIEKYKKVLIFRHFKKKVVDK